MATSILATVRGERDIAVGNVVGSNIYNILAIVGFATIVAPDALVVHPALVRFAIPVMTAVPLTLVTVAVVTVRAVRAERARAKASGARVRADGAPARRTSPRRWGYRRRRSST